jgi:vesicle-fusing ATPase
LGLSLIDEALVHPYEPKPADKPAASLQLKLELLLPPKERVEIDDVELVKQFRKDFGKSYLGVDQVFVVSFAKMPLILTVDRVLGADDGLSFLGEETAIETFASGEQQVRLRSTKLQKKNVFSANFSMDSLGIGGLDNELTSLFRRAFASRRLPHSII